MIYQATAFYLAIVLPSVSWCMALPGSLPNQYDPQPKTHWYHMPESELMASKKVMKNEVKHQNALSYEMGSSSYQVLNPDDEPEIITEDQPHYRAALKLLAPNSPTSSTTSVGDWHQGQQLGAYVLGGTKQGAAKSLMNTNTSADEKKPKSKVDFTQNCRRNIAGERAAYAPQAPRQKEQPSVASQTPKPKISNHTTKSPPTVQFMFIKPLRRKGPPSSVNMPIEVQSPTIINHSAKPFDWHSQMPLEPPKPFENKSNSYHESNTTPK